MVGGRPIKCIQRPLPKIGFSNKLCKISKALKFAKNKPPPVDYVRRGLNGIVDRFIWRQTNQSVLHRKGSSILSGLSRHTDYYVPLADCDLIT